MVSIDNDRLILGSRGHKCDGIVASKEIIGLGNGHTGEESKPFEAIPKNWLPEGLFPPYLFPIPPQKDYVYTVTVITGNRWAADTEADLYIILHGTDKNSEKLWLRQEVSS